ncbi:hypothetical protein KQX54_007164 [Cotesia glomerata]|uniref:Uncharacterized protein n=1 Tax=Cotesia glomerata TaxID=32391 RepID=A0AAV7J536_COTGL|nr:hypothetical protein KQX54_007164 [Cotesia glomerata]
MQCALVTSGEERRHMVPGNSVIRTPASPACCGKGGNPANGQAVSMPGQGVRGTADVECRDARKDVLRIDSSVREIETRASECVRVPKS